MDPDPFDLWYASQLTAEGAGKFKAENWDFFTINHDAGSNWDAQEKWISLERINDWALQLPFSQSPGIDLFFARHKNCSFKNTPYPCLPLDAAHFRRLFQRLSLPAQYFHLRGTGGAHCNAFTCQTYKDGRGNVERTSLVVRIGPGSTKSCGSVWVFALTWDARTRRSIGFVEGISHAALSEMKFHISSFSQVLGHPLTLPEIVLHIITTELNERIRIPSEEAFYREEWRTGLSNLPYSPVSSYTTLWTWGSPEFQVTTARANKSLTTMVFLKRRFRFTAQLTARLIALLAELKNSYYEDAGIRGELERREDQFKQRLLNRLELLETYEHQTECVQKRIENLNTVLYTVISQIDSKKQSDLANTNLQVARAFRSDSIPMRTIAYVTLVFLPGALIAAIFGMNFFQFDPTTHKVLIADTFWHYWAITVPITMLVIAIWNAWNFIEKRKEGMADIKMAFPDEKLRLDNQI